MMPNVMMLRSLPLERDSRSTRMAQEYERRGFRVTKLVWSRGDPVSDQADTVVCEAAGGYGRRLRGLAARLRWMIFIVTRMIAYRKRYGIVHAVDFDTAIIGVPLGRILGKTVVYDAFDSIGAILGQGRLGSVMMSLERRWISAASVVIFPDPVRLTQYGVARTPATAIISNIPDVPDYVPQLSKNHNILRVVYIGTLEARHRGLEYIPEICEALTGRIEFVVGGTGELHQFFIDKAANIRNLSYIGHQTYSDALGQMAKADVMYGPYLLSAPAHRYASPNKMYEHLVLAKPLVTNVGTPPAALVAEAGSGFLFDGTLADLVATFETLDAAACSAAGTRGRRLWDEKFSTLRQTQLDDFFHMLNACYGA
ncbi:hypothetical protein ACFSC3_16915 [Sphingomonas floccifaciens]|uniref:Glycosyltransferase n=1 Tax=Sphingomonas floccifaciens TaxID=1844115 RepID=A0ABW4NI49_9SPHN